VQSDAAAELHVYKSQKEDITSTATTPRKVLREKPKERLFDSYITLVKRRES